MERSSPFIAPRERTGFDTSSMLVLPTHPPDWYKIYSWGCRPSPRPNGGIGASTARIGGPARGAGVATPERNLKLGRAGGQQHAKPEEPNDHRQ